MMGVIIKKGNLDKTCTQKEHHVKIKADRGDAAEVQGTPKIGSKAPETGREAWNRLSLRILRRNQPR